MDRQKKLAEKDRKIRRKGKTDITIVWILIVFIIFVLGALAFETNGDAKSDVASLPLVKTIAEKNKKIIYPQQYSDSHITSNAVIADPRFKSQSVFDTSGLLANTISAVQKNPSNITFGKEKGTWLWTPITDITPKYRDFIISGAKRNGVNVIYLSIDSYLDIFTLPEGSNKDAKKKAFDATVEDFITTALKNGIAVDAEGGWRNWAETGNSYKAFAVLDYVEKFNKTHKNEFRGFQYDVEPYLLTSYQKNKTIVLTNFLDLVGETVSRLNGTDLQFSVVIPEFYDGTDGETPSFSYLGKDGFAIDHLISLLERREQSKIIVMSYRNISKGDDGSIEISNDEIMKANASNVKVIVAQETGNVQPPYITFNNTSLSYLNKQLTTIDKAFAPDKSFGGVAIHYANAFLSLK